MGTGAIIMFLIGAVFLWGGVLVSVILYVRGSRREAQGLAGPDERAN